MRVQAEAVAWRCQGPGSNEGNKQAGLAGQRRLSDVNGGGELHVEMGGRTPPALSAATKRHFIRTTLFSEVR